MPSTYTITELAKEFDITTRTIRFYEDQELLQPTRKGTRRIYSQGDRTRLKLVLRGKRLGWPLVEIREMIRMYDHNGGHQRQLETMIAKLRQNREILLSQREDIELSLTELHELELNCLQQLASLTAEPTGSEQDNSPRHESGTDNR